MNLFQYLFGGMKLGKLIFTLLIVFLMVGGIFYSLNDSSVNTWVKNTQKSIFKPNIGFTNVISGWFKSKPKPEDEIRMGLNSWIGFQPTSKDYVVVEKCNTTEKQFFFLIKKVGTGKVSRVNVSEQEYLNLYRGEVYPYHDVEDVEDLKGQKISVSMFQKIPSSNVNDLIFQKFRVNVSEQGYPYHDVEDLKGKKICALGMNILNLQNSNLIAD